MSCAKWWSSYLYHCHIGADHLLLHCLKRNITGLLRRQTLLLLLLLLQCCPPPLTECRQQLIPRDGRDAAASQQQMPLLGELMAADALQACDICMRQTAMQANAGQVTSTPEQSVGLPGCGAPALRPKPPAPFLLLPP